MKKICIGLVFLIVLCVMPHGTIVADTLQPTEQFYVNDFANVISEDVEKEITEYGSQLNDGTGAQIVLVTVDFTDGETLENYAYNLFNEWGIGSKDKNNGVLILLSIGDDDYWAMQGAGLEETLPSSKISSLLQEYLEPDFAAKDYSLGAEKVYGAFIEELGGHWKEKSPAGTENLAVGQYVYDNANIIEDSSEEYINKKSSNTREIDNAAFFVVTKNYYEEGLNFQDDAIKTFKELKTGSRDAVLILYKEEDNYWLQTGGETGAFATEEVVQSVLDRVLEPKFAVKNYSEGTTETADKFYYLFNENYNKAEDTLPSVAASRKFTSYKVTKLPRRRDAEGALMTGLVIIVAIYLFFRSKRKQKYYQDNFNDTPYDQYNRGAGYNGSGYGVPMGGVNPNDEMYSRPPHNGGGFQGNSERAGTPSSGSGWGGAGRTSFGSSSGGGKSSSDSSWGGAGRSSFGSSLGGGAGRSSSSSSSGGAGNSSGGVGRTPSSGYTPGGGISRGGGAGSSSGGVGRTHGSGYTPGGGTASGGGGVSRGGGAGRK